ncbi:BZ3501_MvSof-1269-A2-R1_C54g00293 [Microbotryum saponariae]|nr:BZ3501_MvSof-1269-A2-R1_C54g00293 [Microbotryum saponariae]
MSTPTVTSADDAGWRFAQCFGDKGEVEDITEADIISTVEFDHTGDYLATGDKGGRVVLFERNETKKGCEYKFYTEFQSHEPEFDYLKSLEIEEKINKIRWCKRQNAAHFLLSTNGKLQATTTLSFRMIRDSFSSGRGDVALEYCDACILLASFSRTGTLAPRCPPAPFPRLQDNQTVEVFEKSLKVVAENNGSIASNSNALGGGSSTSSPPPPPPPIAIPGLTPSSPTRATTTSNGTPYLRLPRMTYHDTIVAAVPRKVYANAHAYHINSISINSDGETYMSADDLRVNLWNLNISDQSFNILDIKPVNMEELTEVITAADSKGTVKLADMREQALCDKHAKLYEEEEDPSNKSFFSEIISSVSDVKFSKDGRYILSRDYLTLRIWDINMESRPVQTINVHDHLRSKLCDLYENDCIFDKFECTFSGDGQHVLSGSYNNHFHIYDKEATTDIVLQADKSAFKAKKIGGNKAKQGAGAKGAQGANKKPIIDVDSIDFNKKILHGPVL